MKTFKIRASACGSIMAGNVGLSEPQQKKLKTFQDKVKAGKELTALQAAENDKLIGILNNPPLPAGLKTFCQKWRKEKIYKRRKEFRSKYTDKGNFCENQSIEFLNQILLENWEKCQEYKENDFLTGTADIVTSDTIIDIKNSWDFDTFPLYDYGIKNKDYYYQLQCYMELYDKPKATLAYTLMDAPFHLIEREAKSQCYHSGIDYKSEEGSAVFHEVRKYMTYRNIDTKYKYKLFHIERDTAVIDKVKERVAMCQNYINELVKELEK
jgi:hypothetical protein